MSSLATSILRRRVAEVDTPMHRIDPRVKFLFFIWISVWAYIFLDYVLTAIFLTTVLILTFIGKVFKKTAKAVAIVVVPWMAVGIPILSALFPWNKTLIYNLQLFGYNIPLYYEGAAWGVVWPLRIGVCLASAMFFLFTTEPVKLIALLFEFKMPFRFIYAVAGALQFTPILLDDLQTIIQAQRSRGMRTDVSLLKRLANYPVLIVPLTLSALNKVQIRAIALESRGFSAPVKKTWPYDLSLKRIDYIFLAGIMITTIIFIYIYTVYGFSPISHLEFYLAAG